MVSSHHFPETRWDAQSDFTSLTLLGSKTWLISPPFMDQESRAWRSCLLTRPRLDEDRTEHTLGFVSPGVLFTSSLHNALQPLKAVWFCSVLLEWPQSGCSDSAQTPSNASGYTER